MFKQCGEPVHRMYAVQCLNELLLKTVCMLLKASSIHAYNTNSSLGLKLVEWCGLFSKIMAHVLQVCLMMWMADHKLKTAQVETVGTLQFDWILSDFNFKTIVCTFQASQFL